MATRGLNTNDPTYYEVALVGPSVRFRVPLWIHSKTRKGIRDAATDGDNFARIIAVAGQDDFDWNSKRQAFVAGEWEIRCTGRTRRECEGDLLPVLPKS